MHHSTSRRNNARPSPQAQLALLNLPPTSTVLSNIFNGTVNLTKRHPIPVSFYLLGLIVALLGTGSVLTTPQRVEYNAIMNSVDTELEYRVSRDYQDAYQAWYGSKGWFTCDGMCERNKRIMEERKSAMDEVRVEGNNRVSDAKSVAGIFSEVGVGETRDSFWEYFNRGTKFAKRQSMWDALFMGMRKIGRDESWGEYALKMMMQVMMNFSIGMIMTLCIFVFGLWGIIREYQPTLFEGVAFFLLAFAAGFATVATVLISMFGTAGAAVFGVAKIAEAQLRLQQEQQGRLHRD